MSDRYQPGETNLQETIDAILNDNYRAILRILIDKHAELVGGGRENPGTIGDDLEVIRYQVNRLYGYENSLYDLLNLEMAHAAQTREDLYKKCLLEGKSDNSAKIRADESCRVLNTRVKVIENTITKVKNNIKRFDTIAMTLQSRMRGYESELRMG